MPKQPKEPTWKEVAAMRDAGRHRVGQNLYLQITARGARSYLFRYKLTGGRQREMGLGSFRDTSLAEAREQAGTLRRLVREGIDPIEHRQREREAARRAKEGAVSFQQAAEQYLADNEDAWKNPKHRQQWRNTLATYVFPLIGDICIRDIETVHVLQVLRPIWREKTETASRVRGRIETVLDWAKAHDMREGENPARWRGHLANVLPSRASLQTVEHHPALAYDKLPAFMADLRERKAMAAIALEFLILTAARSGEVRGATWDEFDLEAGVWTIPADRMKAKREHRVPLSSRALDIVSRLSDNCTGAFVFPSASTEGQLSETAFSNLLKRMKREGITVHGFRSTFRQWCAERTNYPREVAEAALAHVNADKVEAAYQRSDLFEKRRQLMDRWSEWIIGTEAQILSLQRA